MSSTRGFVVPHQVGGEDQQHARDPWVPRFGRTERFAHWWIVVMLASALLTGLAMGDDSGSGTLLRMHAGSVVLIVVGIAAVVLFGDRRALLRFVGQLFRFDRRDAAWLRSRLRRRADRGVEPAWGMFNSGQKLLAWALSASVAALVVTGVQAWSVHAEGDSSHGTAVALTAVLLGAHVFMAVVNPATRPALSGMVFGRVRRSWAAEHHGGWLADLDVLGRPSRDLGSRPTSGRS